VAEHDALVFPVFNLGKRLDNISGCLRNIADCLAEVISKRENGQLPLHGNCFGSFASVQNSTGSALFLCAD
jgi:hypothetical protein